MVKRRYLSPERSGLIGKQYLFAETEYKALHAKTEVLRTQAASAAFFVGLKLVGYSAVADYRAGYELRKHRYIRSEVYDIVLSLRVAAVHVYGV